MAFPVASRRSVSFPRGTMVTYVTWDDSSLVTNLNAAASNDLFYGKIFERSLALACIRHRLQHAVFLVSCV